MTHIDTHQINSDNKVLTKRIFNDNISVLSEIAHFVHGSPEIEKRIFGENMLR